MCEMKNRRPQLDQLLLENRYDRGSTRTSGSGTDPNLLLILFLLLLFLFLLGDLFKKA